MEKFIIIFLIVSLESVASIPGPSCLIQQNTGYNCFYCYLVYYYDHNYNFVDVVVYSAQNGGVGPGSDEWTRAFFAWYIEYFLCHYYFI